MSGKHSLDVRSSFLGSFNTATVLSHLRGCFSPFSKGEVLSIFCFSVASSASFALFCCFSLLGVAVGNKFSGADFCFWVSRLVLYFSMLFCLGFCFRFGISLPKLFRKNSLNVRSSVFGFVLSFLVFRRRHFCFLLRDTAQVVTGHTPRLLSPVLAVRPFFLAFCRGAFLGPVRFGVFVGLSRYFGGLSLLAPSEALFLDARRQGCSGRFFLLFLFSPFCFVCGFFTPTRREGADPSSNEAYPRVIAPAPRPSESPGSAIVRGRFRDIFFASLCLAGSQGPLGPFLEGRDIAPSGPFFTRTFVFPAPQVFFFVFFAFGARHSHWIA